jgi:hypothetical protein
MIAFLPRPAVWHTRNLLTVCHSHVLHGVVAALSSLNVASFQGGVLHNTDKYLVKVVPTEAWITIEISLTLRIPLVVYFPFISDRCTSIRL